MREGYVLTDEPIPHLGRARDIIKNHPEVRQLFGPYPLSALYVSAVVIFQLAVAWLLRDTHWIWVALAAYCVGAFALSRDADPNRNRPGTG